MAEPITVGRLVRELEQLKEKVEAGDLAHGEYDQRLARVLAELRERKLDAERPQLETALADLLRRGVITPAVNDHLRKRLGL